MAFGNDDVEIFVRLVKESAQKDAEELVRGFVDGAKESVKEFAKTEKAVEGVGKEAKKAGDAASEGFSKAQKSIISTNNALDLAKKTASGLVSVLNAVPAIISRGAGFDDLAGSFENLAKQAGTTGKAFEEQLNRALDNTISKSDLYKNAVEALFAGLKPDQIAVAAEAARTFGDVLGGSTLQNLEQFTDALVRGNGSLFRRIGITVDAAKAERDYFKQMGASAKEAEQLRQALTEGERADIARAASVQALSDKLKGLEKPALDAADRLDQVKVGVENFRDQAVQAISKNESLNAALGELVRYIQNTDFTAFIDGLSSVATLLVKITEAAGNTAAALGRVFSFSPTTGGDAVMARVEEFAKFETRLQDVQRLIERGGRDNLSKAGGQLQGVLGDLDKPGAVQSAENLAQLRQEADNLVITLNTLGKEYGLVGTSQKAAFGPGALKQIQGVTGAVKKTAEETKKGGGSLNDFRRRLDELGKSGKGAADKLKQEFEQFGRAVDQSLDVAVPARFTRALGEAFASNEGKPNALAEAIKAIGADAQKAGVPLQALGEKVKELQKLQAEGGFGPGNTEGIKKAAEELARQQSSFGGYLVSFLNIDDAAGELADAIESALGDALQIAAQSLSSGEGRQAVESIVSTVGAAIGTALGTAVGGPAGGAVGGSIGGSFAKYTVVGRAITGVLDSLTGSSAGEKARRSVDAFFIELFDAERLSVIVGGQLQRIRDLTFEGGTPFGGDASFTGGSAFNFLSSLPAQAQAAFGAIGTAFEELLGVGDEISGQLAAVFANNIGGSLQALQVLVQSTGRSFEELGDQIITAFLDGALTIEQAAAQLEQLQELFTPGIPGAIGDIEQAVTNLQTALADGRGSRFLIDSLRDIGAEALELGFKEFPQAADRIAQAFGFSAQQIAAFFQAMKTIGLQNMTDLVNASTAQLIELAKAINQITQGQAVAVQNIQNPTAASPTQVGGLPGNFSSGGFRRAPESTGGKGKGGKSDREKEAERQAAEVYKLLQASAAYEKILKGIVDKELSRKETKQVNQKIRELYDDIASAVRRVSKAEDDYQKALRTGNSKELAKMAEKLAEAEKKLKELTLTSKEAEKALKFDLSKVTPLIRTMNELGVVSAAVGVSLKTNVDILVQGFLRGKLSIQQVTDAINTQKDLLTQGIPGAVGAVEEAFKNLVRGGRQGGLFSVDAFKDIFAEAEERFRKLSSPARQTQLAELTKQFNEARDAFQKGVAGGASVEEVDKLRKRFEGADKALKDFRQTVPKVGFEDLRGFLQQAFSEDQVDVFFRALEESGITTFEEFKNASNEAVVGILGSLDQMGFKFSDVVEPGVQGIIDKLNEAAVAQTQGKDLLQAAVDQVLKFNEGARGLPVYFDETTDAIGGANDALGRLGEGFDLVWKRLTDLTTKDWSGTVLFDVGFIPKTAKDQDLMDALFGDGSGDIDMTIGGGGNGPGLTSAQKREFFDLRRRKKRGEKLSGADQARLDELNAMRAV